MDYYRDKVVSLKICVNFYFSEKNNLKNLMKRKRLALLGLKTAL